MSKPSLSNWLAIEKYESPSLWAGTWRRLFISWTFKNIAYLYCIYCGCPLARLPACSFNIYFRFRSVVVLPSPSKLQLCAHYFTCGVRNSSGSSSDAILLSAGNAHTSRSRSRDTDTDTDAGRQLGMTQFCRSVFAWRGICVLFLF